MARLPISKPVQLEIKRWKAQHLTIDAIEVKMQEDREAGVVDTKMPGRGSIAKYSRQYADLTTEKKNLDDPFEWHRLEEYHLPWQASKFLLHMWAWYMGGGPFAGEEGVYLSPPTFRGVRWWWRIHLVDPQLPLKFIWQLAGFFVERELFDDWLNEDLILADLEAFVAFQAWREENKAAYEKAIQQGKIDSLPEQTLRVLTLNLIPDHDKEDEQ